MLASLRVATHHHQHHHHHHHRLPPRHHISSPITVIVLLQALLERQISSLLLSNLERLDEGVREEAEGVHNTLAIIENIVEFQVTLNLNSNLPQLRHLSARGVEGHR